MQMLNLEDLWKTFKPHSNSDTKHIQELISAGHSKLC